MNMNELENLIILCLHNTSQGKDTNVVVGYAINIYAFLFDCD